MTLNKRYVRNIRENAAFYVSSTVLTVVTLLMFFLYSTTGYAILDFKEDFFERNRVEDAHFQTYRPVTEEQMDEWAERFDLEIEAQPYANVQADGVKVRVFGRTERVDLCEMTVGTYPQAADEIAVSEGFAAAGNRAVGDTLRIGERVFRISGFFQRPDYLYMLEDVADSYRNNTTFCLAYVSDGAFEELEVSDVQYLVRYRDPSVSRAFREAVHEACFMRNYLSAGENPRIAMVERQSELFLIMAYVMLCVLPLLTVALIAIIISRKVRSEQRMIGALSAMGYRKGQLMAHYALFSAIPGLIGGVLTVILSYFIAQPYAEAGLMDYEPMRVEGSIRIGDAILAIVVPTVIYVGAGLLSVGRLLRKDTVLLVNGNAEAGRRKRRPLLVRSEAPLRRKFALRSLIGNPARSFVILLGAFLGCLVMLVGLGLYDSMRFAAGDSVSALGTFEYQYILTDLRTENPYGGEPLLMAPAENEKGESLTLLGTGDHNPCLKTRDEAGREVTVSNGFYMSGLARDAFGWAVGDTVELLNPLSMETFEVTIDGVIANNVQKVIYASPEAVGKLSGLDGTAFNALVSDRELEIPADLVARESSRADMKAQVDSMVDMMGSILWVILALGVILCVAAVYAAVNMMVSENRGTISMLKVLGYRDRQIDRMVLDAHHLLIPVGILLSIPCAYGMFGLFFRLYVDYGLMKLTAHVSPAAFALSIGLTVASYAVSLLLLRRKIRKVSMVESLMDNRE